MKKSFLFLFICIVCASNINAQTTYTININKPEKEIRTGHLDLGGTNPSGEEISVNSYYIEKNGKPFIPVIGEFHYARYPEKYWEESIRKMKAGGINTIATYVFWNIHERQEGKFDWSGNLNLHRFIKLIEKNGMYAIVRMGPFCHGEMRNGGIPDWLYGRPFEIRSNDSEYIAYVDRLYGEIAQQIKGLLYKDGGPVIGVQLENEYQHSAAPWEFSYPGSKKEFTVADRDAALAHEQITVTDGKNPWSEYGKAHMAKLKELAKKHGVNVPLYTATGWGNATIVEKGSLPVTAAYAYPFWAKPFPSPFYLFKDIQKSPDYMPVSYNTDLYPSIPAEIGSGIQVKNSRRPVVDYKSFYPMMIRIIGSGSNGIGYYMYHGGSTPTFDGKFYNEEKNGIPRINYDFQAPIGQYGQERYHYKSLRLLHLFLESFGDKLAPMKTVLPETNGAITAKNTKTLRYAVRSYGKSGFVFIENFQDHIDMKAIRDVNIKVETDNESIAFPLKGTMNMPVATGAIFPFNLRLNGVTVKSATIQPLTVLKKNNVEYYVFSTVKGIVPEIVFDKSTKITNKRQTKTTTISAFKRVSGSISDEPFSFCANGVHFLVISHEMALNTTKINNNIFISDASLLESEDNMELISQDTKAKLHVFPAKELNNSSESTTLEQTTPVFKGFSSYNITFPEHHPDIDIKQISKKKYTLRLNDDISDLNDVFVNIDYVGDKAMAFINGEMITDHFYHDRKWEISLRNFADRLKNNEMVLVFHPMYRDSYLQDLKKFPDFKEKCYLKVNGFDIVPEYTTLLNFK